MNSLLCRPPTSPTSWTSSSSVSPCWLSLYLKACRWLSLWRLPTRWKRCVSSINTHIMHLAVFLGNLGIELASERHFLVLSNVILVFSRENQREILIHEIPGIDGTNPKFFSVIVTLPKLYRYFRNLKCYKRNHNDANRQKRMLSYSPLILPWKGVFSKANERCALHMYSTTTTVTVSRDT